jgi:hypothetical protein
MPSTVITTTVIITTTMSQEEFEEGILDTIHNVCDDDHRVLVTVTHSTKER